MASTVIGWMRDPGEEPFHGWSVAVLACILTVFHALLVCGGAMNPSHVWAIAGFWSAIIVRSIWLGIIRGK